MELSLLVVTGSVILSTVVFLSVLLFYRIRKTFHLTNEQLSLLMELAEQSLQSMDVPVAAILLYQGTVIGKGFNTVLRDSAAGGHAEMNAISNAIAQLGMERFTLLERESLILISTFEPCLMCAGAFVNYNIQNVYFLKHKDLSLVGKESVKYVRYLIKRRQTTDSDKQEELFGRHPRYPGRSADHSR